MAKSNSNYIGYMALEEWARSVDKQKPIYVVTMSEVREGGATRPARSTLVVMCSQPDPRGDVHYCRIVIANASFIGGQAMEPDYPERVKAQQTAHDLVRAWLKEQGFVVLREALVAMPLQSLSLVDGWPGWLAWDETTKNVYRKETNNE